MEDKVELLERIAVALEQQNGIPIWDIVINIIPWIGVIATLVLLLKERAEKNRPYLQVSFELMRSELACIVIRNVGSVPAKLKSMKFNEEFIKQLDVSKIQSLESKQEMKVSIFPQRFWVLSLDKIIADVITFSNTELKIDYVYTDYKENKEYVEETTIDFNEYRSFLLYISEIDELRKMTEKKLTEITKLCDKMTRYLENKNI